MDAYREKSQSNKVKKISPGTERMTIPGMPVGDYDDRFESSGAVLSTNVVVKEDRTSRIEADILNNQVRTIANDSRRLVQISLEIQEGEIEVHHRLQVSCDVVPDAAVRYRCRGPDFEQNIAVTVRTDPGFDGDRLPASRTRLPRLRRVSDFILR